MIGIRQIHDQTFRFPFLDGQNVAVFVDRQIDNMKRVIERSQLGLHADSRPCQTVWGGRRATKIVAELGIGYSWRFRFAERISGSDFLVKTGHDVNMIWDSTLPKIAPTRFCEVNPIPRSVPQI